MATQDGDVYTIDTALVTPDGAGRFNLSELLFIPPPDLAGSMTATLSIKTRQDDVVQETATETTFTVEIDAVADAPTLKAEGIDLDPTPEEIELGNYTLAIDITGIEDNGVTTYSIPVVTYRATLSYLPEVDEHGFSLLGETAYETRDDEMLTIKVSGNPFIGATNDLNSIDVDENRFQNITHFQQMTELFLSMEI